MPEFARRDPRAIVLARRNYLAEISTRGRHRTGDHRSELNGEEGKRSVAAVGRFRSGRVRFLATRVDSRSTLASWTSSEGVIPEAGNGNGSQNRRD